MDTHRRQRHQLGPSELKSRINMHRRNTGRRFGARRTFPLSANRDYPHNVIPLMARPQHSFWLRVDTLCYLACLLVSCMVLSVMWTIL